MVVWVGFERSQLGKCTPLKTGCFAALKAEFVYTGSQLFTPEVSCLNRKCISLPEVYQLTGSGFCLHRKSAVYTGSQLFKPEVYQLTGSGVCLHRKSAI